MERLMIEQLMPFAYVAIGIGVHWAYNELRWEHWRRQVQRIAMDGIAKIEAHEAELAAQVRQKGA